MATLNGIDLGTVQEETDDLQAGLFNTPMPGQSSSNALLLDIMGNSRTLNLSGTKIGDRAALDTWVNSIEALMNGAQSAKTYQSDGRVSAMSVFIGNFNCRRPGGSATQVNWTLSLIEGVGIS